MSRSGNVLTTEFKRSLRQLAETRAGEAPVRRRLACRHGGCKLFPTRGACPKSGPANHGPIATMSASPSERVDWVDYAKGFCIVMVVMMHSTLGVEAAVGQDGWMHYVVAFARPFRMPDFFLISGLFLARVIDRDWRTYVDRKVVHFAYF